MRERDCTSPQCDLSTGEALIVLKICSGHFFRTHGHLPLPLSPSAFVEGGGITTGNQTIDTIVSCKFHIRPKIYVYDALNFAN